MVDDTDRLALLGANPEALEQAPGGSLCYSGYGARSTTGPSRRACSACGAPAVATRRIDVQGLRWLDSCRNCMITGVRGES
jgi:hypothetical protein